MANISLTMRARALGALLTYWKLGSRNPLMMSVFLCDLAFMMNLRGQMSDFGKSCDNSATTASRASICITGI